MFNMLNMAACEGKKSPLVCNFFDTWTAFLHISFLAQQALLYLFEQTGLRSRAFPADWPSNCLSYSAMRFGQNL